MNAIFDEVKEILSSCHHMVVSTSFEDDVTSRMLSTIFVHDKIYFQTDSKFTTIKQLSKNQNIALCTQNVQVKGKATILGPTLQQVKLARSYRTQHESSYQAYSSLPTSVMVEVKITKITMWVYQDTKPYICTYDMIKNVYEQHPYK